MDVLEIARWQFGIITVYHFLFVPLTVGLTALIAVLETQWVRTRKPEYLRLTKFFGRLFLINFAIGVVTGIVQEFQFGMNWSDYSRFVGDIFGAPLAVEGLLAFFLESTFLGLWIFGWDKMPRAMHAGMMWLVHLGTLASSWFILAANSWMQHPVGYTYNPDTGRAELTDFWAVMFNKVQLVTFPHVVLSAYMTAGAFMLGVSAYLYMKEKHADDRPALPPGDPLRRGRDAGGRPRRRDQRRRAGQDHDRGAAHEDGRRGRALRDDRQRAVLDPHRRQARRLRGDQPHRGARPAQLPRHRVHQRHRRGHQPAAREVHRGVRPGPGRGLLQRRATTPRSSRSPTGRSGS